MAKAPDQNASDSEERRLGERIGSDMGDRKLCPLDTRVALAVNYADSGVAGVSNACSTVAKVLSLPPGEYGRKVEFVCRSTRQQT